MDEMWLIDEYKCLVLGGLGTRVLDCDVYDYLVLGQDLTDNCGSRIKE